MESIKIDIKTYNVEKFKFSNPIKTKIGLNSKFYYNNENFTYQTPICKIVDTDNETYCKISFKFLKNFSHFQLLFALEEKSTDQIKKMNHSMIQSYKSCISKDEEELTINVKLVPKSVYFDKKQYQISKYTIKNDDKVILLLNTNGIWMDEKSCTLKWYCFQLVKLT